jgi:hypothetical protein
MTTVLHRLAPLTIYLLKRQYGGPISIYKLASSTTDARTGEKVVTTSVYPVKRAIVMPAGYTRERAALGRLAASGSRDVSERDFIIDRRDVSGLTDLTADDWIVYDSRKYQVKAVETCEFDAVMLITAKELVGEVPEQVFAVQADNTLSVEDQADDS